MDEINYINIYKKMIRKFIIALILLVAIFFLKQFLVQQQMAQEENASYIINIAGRQRMLSQKIVKDILYIWDDQIILEDEIYRSDLGVSLEQWKKAHNELLELNITEKLLKKSTSTIIQRFQDLEPIYLSMVINVEDILKEIEKSDGILQIEGKMNEIVDNEALYLEQMDAIVFAYEKEASEALQVIALTHTVLFLIIISILVFIIFKIFIPLLSYLKNAFCKVNESNKNLFKIFHTMRGYLFVLKRDGEIFLMNSDAEGILSKKKESDEVLYIATCIKWIEFNINNLIEEIKDEDSRIDNIEANIEDGNGNILSVIISVIVGIYNGQEAIMLNLLDLTAQKNLEKELKNMAVKDELTGLYNRRFLESIAEEELERAYRYDIPFSVALLDLDHFKNVNDQWGHPVGDSVLQFTAMIVKNNIRKSDYAIRIGGEEFLIVMPNTDANGALEAAEKVRKVLEATSHPIIGNFTVSAGVAERNMEENYQNLYNRVDEALYQAKKSGRNRVIVAENIKSNYAAVLFKWNQKWNSGEAIIDGQHRELFRLVSQLANNSGMENEKENTIRHIDDIINHVTIHFEYEEKALVQVGYVDVLNHKKMHAGLMERTQEIKNEVEMDKLDYIKAFTYIFDEIIIGHLLEEDKNFYSYFSK